MTFLTCVVIYNTNSTFSFSGRAPFIIIRSTGLVKLNTTFPEGRLGLTYKRPSYRLTGTHPSQIFVLVSRSANRSTLLWSTSRPTLCTHCSLMANTEGLHWVVQHGRRWLALRPLYNSTAIKKGSMRHMVAMLSLLKPGSVSSVTNKTIVIRVTQVSGLVQVGVLMIPARVETGPTVEIMETK